MLRCTKRLVSLAVLTAFSLSVVNCGDVSARAKKPAVPKKVSVRVSQTKKWKITKVKKSQIRKTTWKVSDKKKLKLTKKTKDSVKVKGLKSGTVKVKAVVKMKKGKKTYKLSTTVKVTGGASEPTVQTTVGQSATAVPTVQPTGGQSSTSEPTLRPTESPTPEPPTPKPTIGKYTAMEDLPDDVDTLDESENPPDLLTMFDGSKVTNSGEWEARRREISGILQRYMYGIWRDGSEEEVSYSLGEDNQMAIHIKRGDKEAGFNATYHCPEGTPPEGGWPVIVIISIYGEFSDDYMDEKGYATIKFNYSDVASDNTDREGAFYELYPYDMEDWREQTGAVMAWAWGASKILDALEKGAGAELGISTENTIVSGVSRCGKAAAAAGAFEERFKVSMPVCSGYGGMTISRYRSNTLTYNLLPDFANDPKAGDVADLSAWTSTGGNEPIGSLRGSGWFNETYKGFARYQDQPFDAHYLAAMTAMEDRYLFIITGINSDMWSSPPGFWWTYELAKPAYDLIGLSDNIAIQMHLNLHGVETEDLCKLFAYTDYHFYGKTTDPATFPAPWNDLLKDFTLEDLKTCVFASEANKVPYEEGKP